MIFAILISILFSALLASKSSAQIKTDGTVGPGQSLKGPDYKIPQRLGTTSGQNLFHSFETFGLVQNESATFTGADTIENVISRVTGGQVSSIDGLLRSQIGEADFFFINPAGVVFGPNVQVDVPAAFHVSTADELQFANGNVFSATDSEKSTLTTADPASFGYLSPQPASIVLNGSQLTFAPESKVSLVGGDVTVQGGSSLIGEGGFVQVVATGESQQSLDLFHEESEVPVDGKIRITESSVIDVSGVEGEETVRLKGGIVEINDSEIVAHHRGEENAAGQISFEAEMISLINSKVQAFVYGAGDGNDILVDAGVLEIDAATASDGRAHLMTRVVDNASGDAGGVNVNVERLTLLNGGQISSVSEEMATGNSGNIHVNASANMAVEGYSAPERYSGVYTITNSEAGADGGFILIDAPNAFVGIENGGRIQCSTYGSGASGDITIEVKNLQILDDGELTDDGGIWNGSLGDGSAGDITIKASDAIMIDRGVIIDVSFNTGNAGYISLTGEKINLNSGIIVADLYDIENPGDIKIDSEISLSIGYDSYIEAGKVAIQTKQLKIFSGGVIDCSTFIGDAGNVTIKANSMIIDGGGTRTGIFSNVSSGSGGGGNIHVELSEIAELVNGGQIGSNTEDKGNAGKLTIKAAEMIIDGGGKDQNQFTGLFSKAQSLSSGDGGEIELKVTDRLQIFGGGQISTTANSEGKAGKISIEADDILINGKEDHILTSSILSESIGSSGKGGGIKINAASRLIVTDGGKISTSAAIGTGDGGKIQVDAGQLLIDGGGNEHQTGIFSETQGTIGGTLSGIPVGKGGEILVRASDKMELNNGGQISTSSSFGGSGAGSIRIEAIKLLINDQDSGIYSEARFGSFGDAGDIAIESQELVITESGAVSTSTKSIGNAGMVKIKSDYLLIDGYKSVDPTRVSSLATINAEGNVGNIEIVGRKIEIKNDGEISIEGAQVAKKNKSENANKQIFIESKSILIDKNSHINAASTGILPAAAIRVQGNNLEVKGNSGIITSSNSADGGPITISEEMVFLRDGFITTSVEGIEGDGGDILMNSLSSKPSSNVVVFDGGFIQANTAAKGARGGDIVIDAGAIIAESGFLDVGGVERQVFEPGSGVNVIQAAAPGGEQGSIAITAPNLDISGDIMNLVSGFSKTIEMATDPCGFASDTMPASLIYCGRGSTPTALFFPSTTVFRLKPIGFHDGYDD